MLIEKMTQLISRNYVDMQRTLHAHPEGYGQRGDKWAGIVLQVAMEYQAASVLDYGAGQGTLKQALRRCDGIIRVSEYDPAIPGKDALPSFADLVVCTDVLEHVERDRLDTVLAHIRMLAKKVVFVVVATQPTAKVLEDGRNAHLIVQTPRWWKHQVRVAGFTVHRPPTVVRRKSGEWISVLTP